MLWMEKRFWFGDYRALTAQFSFFGGFALHEGYRFIQMLISEQRFSPISNGSGFKR